MNEVPLSILAGILFFLIILSAFFSSSETGMLSINKYRLKHLVKSGNRSAKKASKLLERPDRLIGVILIGNNFVNILASAIATIIAVRIWGDAGVAIATGALTLIILIFAEVTPKTMATIHPEKIAFPASWVLTVLLKVLYPLVVIVNTMSNGLMRLVGVKHIHGNHDKLGSEELRTVVNEASGLIPAAHQEMLLSILDLENVSVEDIMIPRNEVVGIDIEDSIEEIIEQICQSRHTRMPVYNGEINKVIGILHARHAAQFLRESNPSKAALLKATLEPYFIPESTSINTVLLNFQKDHQQMGIVVDEYGDVQGIAALEDILEEIVGEFTPPQEDEEEEINLLEDGSFRIEGSTHIRDINKTLSWHLPTDGPKTLNGLIIETLEFIPEHPISLWVDNYIIEIQEIEDKVVKYARLEHKR
ncbi:Magnesium and cobalt efflux protein CorC [Marinomonas gallaica]|uniref:Magnesium and cobalt efflux protein CorC n=1 Tax=Marinomonas gallaica TaxID=1806667 RepID=A0A1C3JPP6_9GAMM|nr:HlyC/CorC family transporter [Marinomonas gallaica]SBT17174.1 Magnesium and cobalt efflux protein CorC [Marinomonas gallaica]SBT19509.1 Magnesium and cobalt efflux protein CorC [Marinomonas gallaica]